MAPRPPGGPPGPAAPRSEKVRRFLDGFRRRHPAGAVLERVAALRRLRVLVIGEAIVDEYNYCTPLGKSPKEAVVTTRHVGMERHAGGALACANHVAGFCDEVGLLTSCGDDGVRESFLADRLMPNVTARFVVRPGAPTITKRRYLRASPLVKMFEIVVMDDTPLPAPLEDEMIADLARMLPAYDAVMVADYGHGLLSERTARIIAEQSRFLAVNAQANAANLGFNLVTKYPRADYVCLDEAELRLAMRDRWSPLDELVDGIRERLHCGAVSVTRGDRGALVCGPDGRRWDVPALAGRVVDGTGAGDAYLAVTVPCVAAGMPIDVVGFLGCVAGSLAVQVVGNRSAIEPAALGRRVAALLR